MKTSSDSLTEELTDKVRYRSVFLSDLHIGSPGCKAAELLAFLKSIECDYLYLVGDIIDLEHIHRRRIHWTSDCTRVLRRLLKLCTRETKITYVCGNHDEAIGSFSPLILAGNIHFMERAVHCTADGKLLLIIHGHQFDPVVNHARWLTHIGSRAYNLLLKINNVLYRVRRSLGFRSHWSLSASLKGMAKTAVSFMQNFERAAIDTAMENNYDGVITGHIHTPKLVYTTTAAHEVTGNTTIVYGNCGDGVESMSALVEDYDGNLSLINWSSSAGTHR